MHHDECSSKKPIDLRCDNYQIFKRKVHLFGYTRDYLELHEGMIKISGAFINLKNIFFQNEFIENMKLEAQIQSHQNLTLHKNT